MINIPLLMGAPAGASAQGSSQGSIVQIGMIVAVFAVFWLLIIRPQRKKQKETKNMLSAIKKGDKVTSIGGIKGIVQNVKENTVVVKVDTNTTLEFSKSAIGSVDTVAAAETAPAKKDKALKDDSDQKTDEK